MVTELLKIVLPSADDREVLPLYLRADGGVDVTGRRSVDVAGGVRASFATYFNAFPASYWQRWTRVRTVTLAVDLEGTGELRVVRTDSDGTAHIVRRMDVRSGAARVDVPLEGFDEGGWLWFEATAAEPGLRVVRAAWTTTDEPARAARAAIGITTYNKPDYCAATLGEIGRSADLGDLLDRVFVVDQGTRLVSDEPGFADAADALGAKLQVLRQPNLGGSGGYARAMSETLASEAQFVLLIDDDVRVEPEALRRVILFGAFCADPTIVGGHMIDLLARTRLYAWAEVVDEEPFMWRPLHEERMPIDLAHVDLPDEPLLHRRMDADYNGWWMCLIPRAALQEVGLSLPAFIKWDDAEYSLRARAHGIATVSLPGAALWHISWVGKDDQIDWQAYFHARNRIVAALLHSTRPRGGSVLTHSRRVDLKHLLAMQYYPIELRHRALRAVLSGPGHMHDDLRTALPMARALAADHVETRPTSAGAHPAPPMPQDDSDIPTGWAMRAFMIRALAAMWLRRPRPLADGCAQVRMRAADARWWRLARYDSAIVELAGTGEPHLFVRDRARYRRLLRESIRLHRLLRRDWARLAQEYRAADLSSPERWQHTLRP